MKRIKEKIMVHPRGIKRLYLKVGTKIKFLNHNDVTLSGIIVNISDPSLLIVQWNDAEFKIGRRSVLGIIK